MTSPELFVVTHVRELPLQVEQSLDVVRHVAAAETLQHSAASGGEAS